MRKERILKNCLITAVAFGVSFAATSIGRTEVLPLKRYTTADGLAHDRVNKIVRDSRGFLWFCTSEGLSRFNGYEFKNYTQDDGLPHRAVLDLLETKGGEFWVATNDGVVLFDPKGISARDQAAASEETVNMFKTFRPESVKQDSSTWAVNDLLEDREGTVWAASATGLYRIVRQSDVTLERFGMPEARSKEFVEVQTLLEDRKGAIWAGALVGLYRITPERSAVDTIAANIRVESLLEVTDGNIWVGSAGGDEASIGVHLFSNGDDGPRPIRVFRKSDGLSDDLWMNSLFQTRDGRILVGVANGLCEYTPSSDPKKAQFRELSNEAILRIGEDASGNVWFSTNSSGVRRLAPNGFVSYGKKDGLDGDSIASIISGPDGGTYVLTSHYKISRFNGSGFDTLRPNGMLAGNWSTGQITFPDRTGAWWVASAFGLQRFPSMKEFGDLEKVGPLKTYTTSDGLFRNDVFQLFEDSRGDIWMTVMGGDDSILRWERAADSIHGYTTADGLPSKNGAITFGEDHAGNIWLGMYFGGLYRSRNGKFEAYTEADGLPPGMIRNIFTDSGGRVWVATSSGGVVRIDRPESEMKPPLTRLTTRDGLSSNQTNCITEDRFGRIYISTGRGVNRLDVATGKIKVFSQADGLPENIVTQCKRDASGALWFGTFNGIARYVPIEDEQSGPPPIFLSNLRVNGERVLKFSELGETEVARLDLASDQRQIQVDFFSLGLATGEKLRYQYKLSDADWSEPNEQPTVQLNLSAGSYQLLVRAVNADGIASEQPASVAFSIARPIWQRWWFLLLLAIAVSIIIYIVYRSRLKRLVELERVRTRIATDLHDDIGSSLSQIAILSEVVRQRVGDNGVSQPLVLIADTSREMVDSMSDIVWAINPNKDNLSDLAQRMRRFSSDVLDGSDIAYRFNADEGQRTVGLGAEVRREVYLIFKECTNNIIKHADATEVEMSMKVENKDLVVEVGDNGKGFATTESIENGYDGFGGNGLINMRRRAEKLGGKLVVRSGTGNGTTITIRVPISEKRRASAAT